MITLRYNVIYFKTKVTAITVTFDNSSDHLT
jgi:hypothetical protein